MNIDNLPIKKTKVLVFNTENQTYKYIDKPKQPKPKQLSKKQRWIKRKEKLEKKIKSCGKMGESRNDFDSNNKYQRYLDSEYEKQYQKYLPKTVRWEKGLENN